MKTLTVEFKLPDEANWKAQDEDGDVFWYENYPEKDIPFGIWDKGGKTGLLHDANDAGTYQENWQDTLERIE